MKNAIIAAGFAAALASAPAMLADSLNCNMSQYKSTQGLTAAVEQDRLVVSWTGQHGARSGQSASRRRRRADRRGDQQEPLVRVLGRAARDARIAGAEGRSGVAALATSSDRRRARRTRSWE